MIFAGVDYVFYTTLTLDLLNNFLPLYQKTLILIVVDKANSFHLEATSIATGQFIDQW